MRHVRLGRTGLPVSRLCLGTMTFGGKHARGGAPAPGTRFTLGTAAARYQDRYWHERVFATVEDIRKVTADAGVQMAQLAVSWVLAHPAVTSAIAGASRSEQIADLLPAASADLPADVKAQLDELTADYRRGDDPR